MPAMGRAYQTALEIAESELHPTRLEVDVADDPEFDDRWLEIIAFVIGTPDDILNACDRYATRVLLEIPQEQQRLIRLVYAVDGE